MGQSWGFIGNGSQPEYYPGTEDFLSTSSKASYSTPLNANGLSPSAQDKTEVFESPQTGVQSIEPELGSSKDGYDSEEDTDIVIKDSMDQLERSGDSRLSPTLSVTPQSTREMVDDWQPAQLEHTPRGRRSRRSGSPQLLPITLQQSQRSRDTSLDEHGLPPSSQIPREQSSGSTSGSSSSEAEGQEQELDSDMKIWKAMDDQGIYLSSDDDFEKISAKVNVLDQQGLDTRAFRDSLQDLSVFAKPEEISDMLSHMFSAPGNADNSEPDSDADSEVDSEADSEAFEEYELEGMTKEEFRALLQRAPLEERPSLMPQGVSWDGSDLDSTTEELPPELHLSMLRSHVDRYVSTHPFMQKNHTGPHTVSERRIFTRDVYDYARARGLSTKQATKEVRRVKQAYMRGVRWRELVEESGVASQNELTRRLRSGELRSGDTSDSDTSALGVEIDDSEQMLNIAPALLHNPHAPASVKNGMLSSKVTNGGTTAEKQKWIKTRKPMEGLDVGDPIVDGGDASNAKKSTKNNKARVDSASNDSPTAKKQPKKLSKKIKKQAAVSGTTPMGLKNSNQGDQSRLADSPSAEVERDEDRDSLEISHLTKHQAKRQRKKEKLASAATRPNELIANSNQVENPNGDPMDIDAAVTVSGADDNKKKKRKRKSETKALPAEDTDEVMADATDGIEAAKRDLAAFESALEEDHKKKRKNKGKFASSSSKGAKSKDTARDASPQPITALEEELQDPPRDNDKKSDDKAAKRERKQKKREKRRKAAEKAENEKRKAEATEAAKAKEAVEAEKAKKERKEAKAERRQKRRAERSKGQEAEAASQNAHLSPMPQAPGGFDEPNEKRPKKAHKKGRQHTVDGDPEVTQAEFVPPEKKGPNDPKSAEQAHLNFLKANDRDPHEHALTTDKTPKQREKASKETQDFIAELSDLKRFSNDKQVEAFDHGLYKNANKKTKHDIEEQREGTKIEKGIDPGTGKSVEGTEKKRKRKKDTKVKEESEGNTHRFLEENEAKRKKKRSKVEQEVDDKPTKTEGFHSPMIHQKANEEDHLLGVADDLISSASKNYTDQNSARLKLAKSDQSPSHDLMSLLCTDLEMRNPEPESNEDYVPSSPVSSVLSSPPSSPLSVPDGFTRDLRDLEKPPSQTPQPPSDTESFQPLSPRKRQTPKKTSRKKSALVSPYFKPTPPTTPKKKRPPPGTVSCIPFPPLSSPAFGLIQEKLATDPFKLLVAVTFLNRTKGIHAIPVFYQLMDRYRTPMDLANANQSEVANIVRHLGLQNIRAKRYVQLAKVWVVDPPIKGRRHRRLHYPQLGDGKNIKPAETIDDDDERVAWEIAHLPTAGPYAIDSWRIFCRDVLRGLATGWNGEGGVVAEKTGFEPEWKRVLPSDKELRAFLRWKWLKEGWEWDPLTGNKNLASEDLLDRARRGVVVWRDDDEVQRLDVRQITRQDVEVWAEGVVVGEMGEEKEGKEGIQGRKVADESEDNGRKEVVKCY
ncbi:MAG: hypothetical protein M1812_007447 [Candelaria pacifica]|nr:MAG: hypothetical protein M1812_007447 [Candelaria pacifica]